MRPKIRLAAFDLDGTILQHNSSWAALHRHFGTERASEVSLHLYSEGKIDYLEFMRRDIGAWPKGVTEEEVQSVLSAYKIREEAPGVLEELRKRDIDAALVTAGIDILAKDVAGDLGIKHWVANGLAFDNRGRLLPDGVGRVDPTRKDLAYLELLTRLRVDPKETIAVGDTVYDLAFLKSARLGFMLAHTTRVPDPDIIHIERLTEILNFI